MFILFNIHVLCGIWFKEKYFKWWLGLQVDTFNPKHCKYAIKISRKQYCFKIGYVKGFNGGKVETFVIFSTIKVNLKKIKGWNFPCTFKISQGL